MKRKLHVVYCNLPQLLTNFNEFSEIYNYFVKREANSSKKGYCTRVKLSCNIPFSIKFMYGGGGAFGSTTARCRNSSVYIGFKHLNKNINYGFNYVTPCIRKLYPFDYF